jgi:hypothetical protein
MADMRGFQFSLRALLLTTMVVAIACWGVRYTAFSWLGIGILIAFILTFFSPPSFYGD